MNALRTATVLVVLAVVACGKEENPPPASPTSASTPAPTTTTPPPAADPVVASAVPAAPPPSAAPAAPPPPPDKTFTHSKLGFGFSYPEGLSVKEEAKGATVETEKPIAKVEDRSGKSKTPLDTKLVIRIILEDGNVAAVAKKTNPTFGESFPKGQESAFKEQKDFAEKVTIGTMTGYRFTMGSHGSNEQDTFVAAKGNKTLVVKCSLTGDSLKPTMSELDQEKACDKVVTSLKL